MARENAAAAGGAAALAELAARGILSPLDRHFAAAAVRVGGDARPAVELAAALASRAVGQGHVCLDLARIVSAEALVDEAGEPVPIAWPPAPEWRAALAASPLVAAARTTDQAATRPLVLDGGGRLYLRRYWEYQRALAVNLRARTAVAIDGIDAERTRRTLARLFPDAPARGRDWQRVAAAVALSRRLCVISGGPGTGKTFTVVNVLALLVEDALARDMPPPRIVLLAPTGKAAARLAESLRATAPRLDCAEEVRRALPTEAATVHRALGGGGRGHFARDANNPLAADVVLVDEASMIDLALMAHLVAAVPAEARLILLGDRDQLASVEAGAVLADICPEGRSLAYSAPVAKRLNELSTDDVPVDAARGAEDAIGDCTVQLTRSYRYAADSGIGALARAINDGAAEVVLRVLADPAQREVRLRPPLARGELAAELRDDALRHFAPMRTAQPLPALAALASYRVLCALRRGPFGVEDLNRLIEDLVRVAPRAAVPDEMYAGRPVMVTRNDYQLALFNGDVGVVTVDAADRPTVVFPGSAEAPLRRVAAGHLPEHETVYAASVHKSQGSEFDEVAVVLPDRESPLLTRELLYTAVTRARRAVTIYASAEIVAATVSRRVERASGLRELLWGRASAAGEQLALSF